MAESNGAVVAPDYKKSVKKDDFASGVQRFVFPAYGYNSYFRSSVILPRNLPDYNRWAFYTERDWTLILTPRHEALWANAIAIATTKAAALGWKVSGEIHLRRKRLQELLNYASAGVFVGWVPFISAHIRSYLLTGRAIIEIERETNARGSRITGLHHLNPMRCRFTDNPQEPVEYLDRTGRVHVLKWYQVLMFVDNLDPTEGDVKMSESAGERAYTRIGTTEAAQLFLYEKLTGSRPLSLEFIQGITQNAMKEALQSSEFEQEKKGSFIYRGVVAIPIPGDTPIQRISIPIAELPDGFESQEVYDNANIVYAGAIGLDVSDLDPRLATRGSLSGTGTQSIVLEEKVKGKGLASWKVDFINQIHRLVAAAVTTLAWSERSLADQQKEAQIRQARAATRKTMQEIGEIDQQQSKNLAVDAGDLPREYLTDDATPSASLANVDVSVEAEKATLTNRQLLEKELEKARKLVNGGKELT